VRLMRPMGHRSALSRDVEVYDKPSIAFAQGELRQWCNGALIEWVAVTAGGLETRGGDEWCVSGGLEQSEMPQGRGVS